MAEGWKSALQQDAQLHAVQDAIRARDVDTLKRLWNDLVERLDDQSFYGFLAGSDAFRQLSHEHLETFGQVGFGTGGWDTDFTNSILEVLRVVFTDADDNHRSIVGGAQRLPVELWHHTPEDLVHWPKGTSLASLHGGAPRGAVTGIHRGQRADLPPRHQHHREVGQNQRVRGRGGHVPVMAAVLTDRHRRGALHPVDVARHREEPLHALLQDVRAGGPSLLAGHRP